MVIQRDHYLQKLIHRRENGMVKVINGIRRCGKSYLLFELYVHEKTPVSRRYELLPALSFG
jgi:predicted AAA+ superfamily ATPase